MQRKLFWRSVWVVAVFVLIAITVFSQKASFEAERRYVEPLRVARHRTAAMGSLETVLAEIGVGPGEPYWGAVSIYSSLGMFPQMSGSIVDQDGRTIASVAVDFSFSGAQSVPDHAEVKIYLSKTEADALAEGRFGDFVRDGLRVASVVDSRIEIKRSVSLAARDELVSSVAYRLLHKAGTLVADDEWLNTYGTEPVFVAKGERDISLNLRWRLVGNDNQLFVVRLKESGNEMVEMSVWPVPGKGMSHAEAVRTARERWTKVQSPLATQAVLNSSEPDWRFDEETGCLTNKWERQEFYPDLSEDFR